MLKIVHPICCGMDVHKSFIVACIAATNEKGVTTYKSKRFCCRAAAYYVNRVYLPAKQEVRGAAGSRGGRADWKRYCGNPIVVPGREIEALGQFWNVSGLIKLFMIDHCDIFRAGYTMRKFRKGR